jgi:hypothetical protein
MFMSGLAIPKISCDHLFEWLLLPQAKLRDGGRWQEVWRVRELAVAEGPCSSYGTLLGAGHGVRLEHGERASFSGHMEWEPTPATVTNS